MILIVDDKTENLFSLRSLLTLHDYTVDEAQSGEEALKKILQANYSLIILDVQMPGMDGFEVAEIISGYSRTREIPLIFLSAVSTEKKFITKGYQSGAIDYITKPIDPDIFLLKVKTLHDLFQQKRQLREMQEILRSEIEYRKRAQEDSQNTARQLISILESIPQIAFTTDPGGRLEYVNTAWMNYAHSPETFPSTHTDDPSLDYLIRNMVELGRPLEQELRIRIDDSEVYKYFLLRTVPVKKDEQIEKWVGTLTDIDEQKQASKRKDEFISVASHELKTPLTSVKGYIQLVERMTMPDSETHKLVDRALVQINKFQNLITDLFDVSKLESGKMKLEIEDFVFRDLLLGTLDMVRQTYPDYEFAQEGELDVTVRADKTRLEQVLLNFLSNAAKYSPENKRVEIHTSVTPDHLLDVRVKDFGIGIPGDEQSHVFDKYYRASQSIRNIQGMGLGLFICADILQRHGFPYGVESEPSQGSVFYFQIPIINDAKPTMHS